MIDALVSKKKDERIELRIGDVSDHCQAKIIPQPSASLPVGDGGILWLDCDHVELESGTVFTALPRDTALTLKTPSPEHPNTPPN